MTITEVSKAFAVTPEALWYYERIGLLPKIEKDGSRHRNYTERDLGWVHYVTALRKAGVSIDALLQYVHLFMEGDATREARRQILLRERARLAERMEEMQKALDYLDLKIENYDKLLQDFETEHLAAGREKEAHGQR